MLFLHYSFIRLSHKSCLIFAYNSSLEGVEGIIQWGFWDQLHWQPCSAIATGDDVHPNEAGVAYLNIYHEFVRTNTIVKPTGTSRGNELQFQFRGFKGTYSIMLVDENGNDIRMLSGQTEVEDNIELLF